MSNSLQELRKLTTLVADSGDVNKAVAYSPQDATTNPSLLLTAAKLPEYEPLIAEAVQYAKDSAQTDKVACAMERLIVNFGARYLEHIPGRVSTQVDASLSYDTEGTVEMALRLVELYASKGIDKSRILIKIAATFEGIRAARILETEHNVHCNITLIFSVTQAMAASEANATLISPFVGRILDWHKRNKQWEGTIESDPGVLLVKSVFEAFQQSGSSTVVMGASFRNTDEIIALAGIDMLTISPGLLAELEAMERDVPRQLSPMAPGGRMVAGYLENRELYDQEMAADVMATELLTDGIRRFKEDAVALKAILAARFE